MKKTLSILLTLILIFSFSIIPAQAAVIEEETITPYYSYTKLRDLPDEASATGQYTTGHGTMVSGVIAAQGNNNKGIAGVASIASNDSRNFYKIMAIKCDNNGSTNDRHITQEHLHKAVQHAIEKGAEVINISYSQKLSKFNQTALTNLQNKISDAISAGITVVCSAGNDGSTEVRYPAGFTGVIGVGASLKNGRMSVYSNRSAAVDIVAPGGYANSDGARIRSTNASGGYSVSHGTSYAAPHVSATVAMMKSINYRLTPAGILTRLLNRGNDSANHSFKELDTGESVRLTDEYQ